MPLSLLLPDENATRRLAHLLEPGLRGGDTLLLDGPVGAGKSALARAVIRARMERKGMVEDIPSPTFTLVQSYPLGNVEFWHADLYRLTSSADVHELGLEDAFEDHICLVEWPDRLGALAPASALWVTLTPFDGDTRRVLLEWTDARWNTVTNQIAQAFEQ